jgi:tetratricopeptide (TPR) repeat protein
VLRNGYAFALYRAGRPVDAEAEFRRVLERSPDREESVRGLAAVLFTSQRFEECLPIVDKLRREHPGDKESEHHLVTCVDGMMTTWQKAGKTPADMVAEGWRLAEAGNRRSGVEIFRWVLQIDPFHPGARLGVGKLGPEFGYDEDARRCLDELLRENPNDTEARTARERLQVAKEQSP